VRSGLRGQPNRTRKHGRDLRQGEGRMGITCMG
jgi:hypothetical protein